MQWVVAMDDRDPDKWKVSITLYLHAGAPSPGLNPCHLSSSRPHRLFLASQEGREGPPGHQGPEQVPRLPGAGTNRPWVPEEAVGHGGVPLTSQGQKHGAEHGFVPTL